VTHIPVLALTKSKLKPLSGATVPHEPAGPPDTNRGMAINTQYTL
jgi:hypothetical protein